MPALHYEGKITMRVLISRCDLLFHINICVFISVITSKHSQFLAHALSDKSLEHYEL